MLKFNPSILLRVRLFLLKWKQYFFFFFLAVLGLNLGSQSSTLALEPQQSPAVTHLCLPFSWDHTYALTMPAPNTCFIGKSHVDHYSAEGDWSEHCEGGMWVTELGDRVLGDRVGKGPLDEQRNTMDSGLGGPLCKVSLWSYVVLALGRSSWEILYSWLVSFLDVGMFRFLLPRIRFSVCRNLSIYLRLSNLLAYRIFLLLVAMQ
jgi:hypothetical protein